MLNGDSSPRTISNLEPFNRNYKPKCIKESLLHSNGYGAKELQGTVAFESQGTRVFIGFARFHVRNLPHFEIELQGMTFKS